MAILTPNMGKLSVGRGPKIPIFFEQEISIIGNEFGQSLEITISDAPQF